MYSSILGGIDFGGTLPEKDGGERIVALLGISSPPVGCSGQYIPARAQGRSELWFLARPGTKSKAERERKEKGENKKKKNWTLYTHAVRPGILKHQTPRRL